MDTVVVVIKQQCTVAVEGLTSLPGYRIGRGGGTVT